MLDALLLILPVIVLAAVYWIAGRRVWRVAKLFPKGVTRILFFVIIAGLYFFLTYQLWLAASEHKICCHARGSSKSGEYILLSDSRAYFWIQVTVDIAVLLFMSAGLSLVQWVNRGEKEWLTNHARSRSMGIEPIRKDKDER